MIKILVVEDDPDARSDVEVVRRMCEEDEPPIILVVTARREAEAVIRSFSLNHGTDDIMAEPFDLSELTARIRAILRNSRRESHGHSEPRIRLDALTLDPVTYDVTWRDESLRLTPTEFRILYILVTNAGHVVPASRLYRYVWGSEGADANALRSHISHLRRKLEATGPAPGKITSIPAVGYVFRRTPQPEAVAPVPLDVAKVATSAAPVAAPAAVPSPAGSAA